MYRKINYAAQIAKRDDTRPKNILSSNAFIQKKMKWNRTWQSTFKYPIAMTAYR